MWRVNFKCGQNGNRASSWKIKADPVSCFTVGKRGGDTKQGNILKRKHDVQNLVT